MFCSAAAKDQDIVHLTDHTRAGVSFDRRAMQEVGQETA